MITLSTIIPVYNVENYLAECLNSVVTGIKKLNNNKVEIILVNDGSTDDSLKICQKYAKVNKYFRIVNKKNGGLSSARNEGIKIARGSFISFIDSDDVISTDYFFNIFQAIEIYKFDVLIFKYKRFFEVKNTSMKKNVDEKDFFISSKKECINDLTNDSIGSFAWNKVYRKQLFTKIAFPEGKYFEDIFTTYKLFKKSQLFIKTNKILYYYRQRKGSIMHQTEIKKQLCILNDAIVARYNLFLFLQKNGSLYAQKANNKFLFGDCIHLIKLVYKNNYENKYLNCLSFIKEFNFCTKRDGLKNIVLLKTYRHIPKLLKVLCQVKK
ncbi:glycosyltransferase family 2 protein [Lactobacillus helveticus]|uniref:glycosyltransferase family 2 protein n=1 Tax=Lactobacillus helveticus TaxID=1587 RepID=UPI001109A991|nr:glycosyltransferase family 2 protein [Lactobacillus helveticus]TLQ21275.1 glycosyltransferase family 2 protein [Lactobacillus helveticus]